MADNICDIAVIAPLKFTKKNFANPLPYNTKYMEDWQYPDTIPFNEILYPYARPWQKNDIINLQLLSNYGPHNLHMLDCSGAIIDSFQAVYKPSSIEGSGQKAYEFSIALNTYDEGYISFRLESGAPILETMETGLLDLRSYHEGTVQFKCKHDQNDMDTVFETGIELIFRVHGGFVPENWQPSSDRTVFVNQPESIVQVSNRIYYTDKLIIGSSEGLPNDVMWTVAGLFRCSQTLIDGKQWTGIEGSKFEGQIEPGFPLKGWLYEVRPTIAETKKRFIADGLSNNPSSVAYQFDTTGLGQITGTPATNVLLITEIN